MKKQTGFTLVEIAIVLVIVGLLIGGVLKGQEIITNAKIKSIENDYNAISAAIYSYQDRYRSLPGDDKKATGRFTGVTDGDGDYKIEGAFNADTGTSSESLYFWQHLRAAGLVSGSATNDEQPLHAFDAKVGASSDTVASLNLRGIYIGFELIPVDIAKILEARSDDEDSTTGSIQATIPDGTAASSYDTSSVDNYNLLFLL